jgi:uncharacterized protein YbaR (Trm112 family)/ubiquinone/menaquinone biosynthesis C-methylase UbiE
MKTELLQILRCPHCQSQLRLQRATDGTDVDSGELECQSCARTYPIVQGVPRMVLQDGLIARTREGFAYQWSKRQSGRAERKAVVYGYEIGKFMDWFVTVFTPGLQRHTQVAWLLDAGCGSGEKARELARRFPQHQIVAIDQSNSIARTAWENADLPNLHFVQANVWHPPFAERSLQFAMSIGVLHHTPDTLRAFNAIARLVAPGGDFMSWLYPLPHEDAFWAGLYRQRDRHFLGIAHRLPNWLTLWLCRAYVALFFPLVLHFLKEQYKVNKKLFPIYPDRPALRELFHSAVFLSFDNVMPPHQFRHGRPEVRGWYADEGFGPVNDRYPGFFHAVRERATT